MANSPFQIPGNIKQQFLPFLLNPGAKLNSIVKSSTDLQSGCDPQIFSFKTNIPYMWSGSAKLNICPTTFEKFMHKDISNQLLFSKENKGKSITFNDIYNSLPSVQIREFLPDTRLDQAINLFSDFIGKVMELLNNKKDNQNTTDEKFKTDNSLGKGFWENMNIGQLKDIGQDIVNTVQHAWNFMTGTTQPTNLFVKGGKTRFTGYDESMYKVNLAGNNVGTYVMSFPWAMYYKLQSCVTSNIYEIPCKTGNNFIMSSDGTAGWTGGSYLDIEGGKGNGNGGGLISKVVNLFAKATGFSDMFNNIRVNFMPFWNSKDGNNSQHPAIEITFDLYNDTSDAALTNFIFVNTIIPNNRWVQYNMFQHSSPLYDIKIDGLTRLFACTGKFDATYLGVLRDPPDEWIDNLVKKHGNKNVLNSDIASFIKNNKLIKIPDIYQVKMTFSSLLPNNFNNYIFSYSQNINSIQTYYTHTYDESLLANAIITPVKDFWTEMKNYVSSSGYNTADKDNDYASYS